VLVAAILQGDMPPRLHLRFVQPKPLPSYSHSSQSSLGNPGIRHCTVHTQSTVSIYLRLPSLFLCFYLAFACSLPMYNIIRNEHALSGQTQWPASDNHFTSLIQTTEAQLSSSSLTLSPPSPSPSPSSASG
jgi:hypothetical protein